MKRGNPDQYLQKVGGTYYARVRVPRTLEKYTGQTHIRRTLGTGSRAEANLRKHSVVSKIKAELASLRDRPPADDAHGITFADARAMREQMEEFTRAGDHERLELAEAAISTRVETIAELHGDKVARRWYRTAATTDETLSELMEKWLGASDYKESTKAGHKKALNEVLSFVEDKDAHPADVTRAVAIRYVDNDLTKRSPPLSSNTIRDRLVSLGGFWSWLESRNLAPPNANPWTNHRISKKQNLGTRPPKRKGGYTEDELLQLLAGNDQVRRWPTYSYMPDVMVLGMFTGARIESLCSLQARQVEKSGHALIINVLADKTEAGERPIGVTHAAPIAVLKRRLAKRKPDDYLFPELTPGGLDDKMSSSVVKAYGRYRRTCGVPDGTDFHSFRRNVITVLEQAGVGQVAIARFVGHQVGTMAADVYSGGGNKANSLETSRKVTYGAKVEAAALALVGAA